MDKRESGFMFTTIILYFVYIAKAKKNQAFFSDF